MSNSLYIHIPFCSNICGYCDFCKVIYEKNFADRYVEILTKELIEGNFYETIYIGGGSPSSLNVSQLENLLHTLYFRHDETTEFTIEVNPEDMNEEKVKLFTKYGVNRVSIGVQTFKEDLLSLMDRRHTPQQVVSLIQLLKKYGITNINLDLMYGLPNQTIKDIKQDLDYFLKLGITHISTYAFQLENNTKFNNKKIEPLDDDIQADMYEFISKYLKKHKFIRYEVSNFSLAGYESKHNLVYWNAKEYKGVGVGASGYENGIRYDNSKSLTKYLIYKDERKESVLTEEDKKYEYIILHLRLKDGIDLSEYNEKYQEDFLIKYKKEIEELLKNKMVGIKKNHLFVKENKMFILNRVLQYFSTNEKEDKYDQGRKQN